MATGKKAPPFAAQLVDYLINEYFSGDIAAFAARVEYSKQQIAAWRAGTRKPQKATTRWLLSATLAPEFTVVAEFKKVVIQKESEIRKQLTQHLQGHADKAGVYAFYDSMCNVIYIGKASSSLLTEMYQQLRAPLGVAFPKAVKSAPTKRWEVVERVSAYEIPSVDHLDYPKHVEALVLRLSKPVGNKVLGTLNKSSPPKEPV